MTDPNQKFLWISGVKTILKISLLPIIGLLFHPVYTIVNTATCGRMGHNELAGFGLGSLSIGILCESLGMNFTMTLATLIT
jgi:Na+-driven multidrug efflux pump